MSILYNHIFQIWSSQDTPSWSFFLSQSLQRVPEASAISRNWTTNYIAILSMPSDIFSLPTPSGHTFEAMLAILECQQAAVFGYRRAICTWVVARSSPGHIHELWKIQSPITSAILIMSMGRPSTQACCHKHPSCSPKHKGNHQKKIKSRHILSITTTTALSFVLLGPQWMRMQHDLFICVFTVSRLNGSMHAACSQPDPLLDMSVLRLGHLGAVVLLERAER